MKLRRRGGESAKSSPPSASTAGGDQAPAGPAPAGAAGSEPSAAHPADPRTPGSRPGSGAAGGQQPAPLGEVLLRRGVITPDQLAGAIVQQAGSGLRLGELLVDLGVVDERQVTAALATQLGLPVADLSRYEADPSLAGLLPETLARSLRAIPIYVQQDQVVIVACSDPRPGLAEELGAAMGLRVRLALASPAEVQWAIDNSYRALAGLDEQVAAFVARHGETGSAGATAAAVKAAVGDAPVVMIANMIVVQAVRDRASDIHIEPHDKGVRIRYRIDGALHEVADLPASMGPALVSRIKIMAGMNIVERRRAQDGQINMETDGRPLDIRVSTIGVIWGEKVVMRVLDKSRSLYRLRELGMTGETCDEFEKMLRSPFGMVLCAGPTGSGKTTTLYASLNAVNSPDRNITTIEDPVEYVFPAINQIQINELAGVTFAGGLRSILRQDPDMILVGEIRDVETARIAVQAALTGHFVLSSVHATDSVSSLYRFLDMGIESFLIASSVLGIVGQRLVRLTCRHCRVRYTPTNDEMAFYREGGGAPKQEFWRGLGCNYCSQTGYSGRVGVYELLRVTEEMREMLVLPESTHADIRRLAIAQGMQPLRRGGIRLVERDDTTIAEIIRSIYTL
ncbi:MAG: GspE/PulE family protein [Candidatus Nanopelagicales bacterium]|nr:GspE/PulE family protein [Candidatus Nanopelagicales bacterium]